MDTLVREFNVDCVVLKSSENGGGVMGGMKVKNVGYFLHDLALRILSLNLDKDVFRDIRGG